MVPSPSGDEVATIEVTGGLLKAIKKRTGRTRKEMGQLLDISEKWYGLIESGEKEISRKVKDKAQIQFEKEIEEILRNEKVNIYMADPDLLEEFLVFARKTKLQKEIRRKQSNDALLKVETLALGFDKQHPEIDISTLRSQLLPDDLEKARIYLAAFDANFDSGSALPENQASIESVKWFLKTMNHIFSEAESVQISASEIEHHRRCILPGDRQRLIEVAQRVDDANHISENQDESMVSAWKLLLGDS